MAAPKTGERLHWIIVGGESGPGARPCDLSWIRSIRDQCRTMSVPCFVKQLGSNARAKTAFDEDFWYSLKDQKGGNPAEWPSDLRVRESPE